MYNTLPPSGLGAGGVLASTGVPQFQVVGLAIISLSALLGGILLLRVAARRRRQREAR
jgi:hypothetical protein